MKTIQVQPFAIHSPCNYRGYSITTLKKNSQAQNPLIQTPDCKSYGQEDDFVQRVSKKYLYFHESPNKSQASPKNTISFPYTAINLCYFEKNFGDIKQKKLRKHNNFNTNNDISNYLNMRLKTEPTTKKQISPEQEIYIGKKIDEKRIHNEQNLKHKIFFSIERYQLAKNSLSNVKPIREKKLPSVLKIKSKKAYFLGRIKSQKPYTEKSTKNDQKSTENQEQQNVFELKYRSRTEDNINMINEIREDIRKNLKIKERKREKNLKKQKSFEPWEVDTVHGSISFHVYENYY